MTEEDYHLNKMFWSDAAPWVIRTNSTDFYGPFYNYNVAETWARDMGFDHFKVMKLMWPPDPKKGPYT